MLHDKMSQNFSLGKHILSYLFYDEKENGNFFSPRLYCTTESKFSDESIIMYFLDQTDKRHFKKRIEIRARIQMLILELLKSKEGSCLVLNLVHLSRHFLLSVVGLQKFTLLLCVLCSVYSLLCFCWFFISSTNQKSRRNTVVSVYNSIFSQYLNMLPQHMKLLFFLP